MAVSAILFLIAFVAGWYALRLAERKGRNSYSWMSATVLLGVPVFILMALPAKAPIEPSQPRTASSASTLRTDRRVLPPLPYPVLTLGFRLLIGVSKAGARTGSWP